MGIIETEIEELRLLTQKYDRGLVTDEHVRTMVSIYGQTHKRVSSLIQLMGMAAKHGNKILNRSSSKNLIGRESAIDLGVSIEDEKIKCIARDDLLFPRSNCIDYSGSHPEECNGCRQKAITNALLLDS